MRYADAGVSLTAWEHTRDRISTRVRSTYTDGVLGAFGQFGGLFDIGSLSRYRHPVLVSSIDGVGTKLKIACEMGIHATVGRDIVNHCVNDILVLGAEPLFFLDYLGTGRLEPDVAEKVIEGMADACAEAGCALIGGETAEMPGFYHDGEYDLAGTIVGVVEREGIIDGRSICPGDSVVGLASDGLHTNGYSLARKIVTEAAGMSWDEPFEPGGRSIGEELLRPHRSYLPVRKLMGRGIVKGCAHITGGGIPGNLNRVLPGECDAVIETHAWAPRPIFEFLRRRGRVEVEEMYRTFNMGVGLALVVAPEHEQAVCAADELREYEPVRIGTVVEGKGEVRLSPGTRSDAGKVS